MRRYNLRLSHEVANPRARKYWANSRKHREGLIIDRREVGDPGAFDGKTDEELMEEARNRAAALGLLPPETRH